MAQQRYRDLGSSPFVAEWTAAPFRDRRPPTPFRPGPPRPGTPRSGAPRPGTRRTGAPRSRGPATRPFPHPTRHGRSPRRRDDLLLPLAAGAAVAGTLLSLSGSTSGWRTALVLTGTLIGPGLVGSRLLGWRTVDASAITAAAVMNLATLCVLSVALALVGAEAAWWLPASAAALTTAGTAAVLLGVAMPDPTPLTGHPPLVRVSASRSHPRYRRGAEGVDMVSIEDALRPYQRTLSDAPTDRWSPRPSRPSPDRSPSARVADPRPGGQGDPPIGPRHGVPRTMSRRSTGTADGHALLGWVQQTYGW